VPFRKDRGFGKEHLPGRANTVDAALSELFCDITVEGHLLGVGDLVYLD
jgi:hypothetical protein